MCELQALSDVCYHQPHYNVPLKKNYRPQQVFRWLVVFSQQLQGSTIMLTSD